MAGVILKQVSKVYPGGVTAVSNASLEIADHEFVVLVGPSGCGKSTTLRMIAGLEEISSGTIAIGGRVVNDRPPKDRDIAMVFQNYALYPHMTVFENLAFGLKLRRVPRIEIEQRVGDAARILDISDLLHRRPKALSGGQRQRVAVGRAMVRNPAVFLFDEPLSNLDAKMRVEMRVEINRLHQRLNSTMVYVTHDQVEAMTLGDRIVVMDHGLIQQVGPPLTVYDEPCNQFVAGFIGTPPMNFLDGRLDPAGNGRVFTDGTALTIPVPPDRIAAEEARPGRRVRLGIRPEHIHGEPVAVPPDRAVPIRARVDVVELLGNEKLLHLALGPHTLMARLSARAPATPGQAAELTLDTRHLHFFDPDDGRSLTVRTSTRDTHLNPSTNPQQEPQ
jgi:multiple sugar transport system ATP-binding protein